VHVRGRLTAVLAGTCILCSSRVQSSSGPDRAGLASRTLEAATPEKEPSGIPTWLVGLLTGIFGGFASIVVARWTRLGALDQAVHEKRLECYPKLVKATSPLALYFPAYASETPSLTPAGCRAIGREMSEWYFGTGGLLMSEKARDSYFRLARALSKAAQADSLSVPVFPGDTEAISSELMITYQEALIVRGLDIDDVEEWKYGPVPSASDEKSPDQDASVKFKDYVFLQNLSSRVRTSLADDLRGRRRPY
jgi:hypothetical protein